MRFQLGSRSQYSNCAETEVCIPRIIGTKGVAGLGTLWHIPRLQYVPRISVQRRVQLDLGTRWHGCN